MEKVIADILSRPFEDEEIHKRIGRGGKEFSYVPAHAVIRRLNEAFQYEWSFHINDIIFFPPLDSARGPDEVIVIGQLTAHGESKTQCGSKVIAKSDSGSIISLGDDVKAAASDALKKCASLFGVALHLYEGEPGEATSPEMPGSSRSSTSTTRGPTARQLQVIDEMILASPYLTKDERSRVEKRKRVMDRAEASRLITHFLGKDFKGGVLAERAEAEAKDDGGIEDIGDLFSTPASSEE